MNMVRELLNRNIAILLVAQVVAITGTISLVTLGGIVGRDLAPSPALATLALSLFVIGTAAGTVPAAWVMSRIGRARGFACGAAMGLAGSGCVVAAMTARSFLFLCTGAVFVGFATAFSQQYRFASAESVAPSHAAQAVSVILLGSIVGAIIGPELAVRGEFWLDGAPFAGTFAGVAGCYVFAGVLLLMLREPAGQTAAPMAGEVRSLRRMAGRWVFVVPVLGAAMGQGVMVFVMTAAPLAMHVADGYPLRTTAAVVQAHVLAMYVPSLVTGALIGRFGAVPIMLAGTLVLCVMVVAGSIVGAIIGPELAVRGEFWLDGAPFAGTFAGVAGCYVFAGVLLLMLREPAGQTAAPMAGEVRSLRRMAGRWVFVVPVLGAAMGQGVMVFVMTAAPLAMHVADGYPLRTTAAVVQAHVLAMYVPSLVTGALIGRFGAVPIMLAGTLVLCVMVVAGFLGREVLHYGASMVALGVGWNFLFIGGTTLLAGAHRPAERFRAQAVNEFSVFGLSAVGSLSAGVVMQLYGWNAVLWGSLPLIVATMAVLFWAAQANIQGSTPR